MASCAIKPTHQERSSKPRSKEATTQAPGLTPAQRPRSLAGIMPASLVADWSAVRATAIALNSLRAAADAHAVDGVTYAAICQRARREHWPVGNAARGAREPTEQDQAFERAKAAGSTSQAVVSRPVSTDTGDRLAAHIARHGRQTRASLATAFARAGKHGAKLPGRKALAESRHLTETARGAAIVHGWASEHHVSIDGQGIQPITVIMPVVVQVMQQAGEERARLTE